MNEADLVDRDRLEAALERIRAAVPNPDVGIFGPGSMVWRIYREQVISIAAGATLLLQTAHPYVAHAVRAHSAYRTDPLGRGERTFQALFAWIYGDLDRAFAAARRTWGVHRRITGAFATRTGPFDPGDGYAANDPHALFWVHTTLMERPWRVHELMFGPLTREERERFYGETKLFALLFGIDDAIVPPTFDDFLAYVEEMFESDLLAVDDAGREIARFLFKAPTPSAAPAIEYYKVLTAGLLPPRVRHGYRFRWGRLEEGIFEASLQAYRAGSWVTPPLFRYSPIYRHAMHRARGTSPDVVESTLDRVLSWTSRPMPSRYAR